MLYLAIMGLWSFDTGPTEVEPEKLLDQPPGQVVVLEDLVTSVLGAGSRRQLRLRRCPSVIFRVRNDDLRVAVGHVRITGTTRKDGAQFFVDVTKVELLPTDEQTFEARSKKIDKDDFEGWYDLGRWARQRADLYENEQMRSRSELAVQTGLQIEHRQAQGDPEKLESYRRRLSSERARKEPDLDGVDHEILRAQFARSTPASPEELEEWSQRISAKLMTEGVEARKASDELIKRYEDDPVAIFNQASRAERLSLGAYWIHSLQLTSFQLTVERDSLTPFEAANLADARFPRDPGVARDWIERGVREREQRLLELRRSEVESLVERVRSRLGDDRRASDMQKRWLEHQFDLLKSRAEQDSSRRDVRAYVELASIYLEWMPSDAEARQRAADLLKEGLKIEPGLEPAKERLKELGYRLSKDGRWMDADEWEASSRDPSRSVRVGMTADDVLQSLGSPDERNRIATSIPGEVGKIHIQEQWKYRGTGVTIFVLLDLRGVSGGRVSSVNTLQRPD